MNIFGKLLKDIRIFNNYTQKDLAAKLSIESEEFSQIDLVTISRWERGMTSPNNAKALRVLRCLTKDVRPFLSSLMGHQCSRSLDDFVQQRFGTNIIQSTLAAFGVQVPTNRENFRHDKLIKKVNDPILKEIREYHSLFNQDRLDLLNIDLYLYQEEKKLHGYRFYEETKPEKTIGNSLYFFMNTEDIEKEVKTNGCDIDLRKSVRYRESNYLSMYLASGVITSAELFKYHWTHNLEFLSTHSNIVNLYVSVLAESVVPFLMNIGFEVVATKNPIFSGGVKIGRRHYERCVMKIDTSVLLTSKEALSLIASRL